MHNKGPSPQLHDGSGLRIGIVHARWNDKIIDPLLEGTKAKLRECGVKESNIVVQTVPGSWELPIAVQRCVQRFAATSSPSLPPRSAARSCPLPPSPTHNRNPYLGRSGSKWFRNLYEFARFTH